MPVTTLSIRRLTPMTPVEATSTCSGLHPMPAATSAAMRSASRMPWTPVQAFAHPLFTTMARATPLLRSRWRFETRTGAACARLVVKIPAAEALPSAASTVRSSDVAAALMPQWSAAERKPCGAVTPPDVGAMVKSRTVVGISGMQGRQRHTRLPCADERQHDGVLPAGAELRARSAVGVDLFRQPRVRHD